MVKQILLLSFIYFSLVFLAGLILGSIRVPYLQPLLGARYAELLEIPLMLFIIWHAAQITIWNLESGKQSNWWFTTPITIGLLSLLWLVAVEVSITAISQDQWLGDAVYMYFLGRDVVAGPAYGLALLVYAVMPLIAWNAQVEDLEGDRLVWDFDEVKAEAEEEEDYCNR